MSFKATDCTLPALRPKATNDQSISPDSLKPTILSSFLLVSCASTFFLSISPGIDNELRTAFLVISLKDILYIVIS